MRLTLIFFVLILSGCNLDIDTSDPMASKTINDSKKDGFFLREYNASSTDTSYKIKEAWIEHIWFNEVKGFRVYKKSVQSIQLNLRVASLPLNGNEYFLNWEMADSTYGIFGTSNGCYVLDLKQEKIPDSFKIDLYKIDLNKIAESRKDKQIVCTIFLK